MNVILLTHTPEPEKIVAAAAKLCYSQKADIQTLMDGLDTEATNKFIDKLMTMHHESPLEHVSFTFAIEGVSRALLAQITRHRIASFSVRSQRYCSEEDFDSIIPDPVYQDPKKRAVFRSAMADIKIAYNELQDLGSKNEDARSVLPNACATRMIITMNLRELLHFFNLRCCVRAQAEIRELANRMLILCEEVSPILFTHAGAHCEALGYCPEGKMSCGRAPTLEKLLDSYHTMNGAHMS